MKYYYTYKITLLKGSLAGHYYFGQHTTSNLNDGYAGSGRKITDYYKKYGKIEHQTYIKEIIAFYNNLDELNNAEAELIGDKYDTDNMCLNLKAGGNRSLLSAESVKLFSEVKKGNNHPMYGKHHSEETRHKMSEAKKGDKNYLYGKHLSEETKKKLSESHKGRVTWIKGKHLSEEARQKKSISMKGKNKGKHRVYNEDHTKYLYE